MRCGLYIRVSTDMQKERGESLEVQLKRLHAYVDSKEDWQVVETYKDAGMSAKNTNRPEFSRMLEDIKQGRVEVVLCTKLDRLFRSTRDFLNTLDFFEKAKINFVCLEGSIDTSTPAGRVFSTMRAAFAQFERETTADRVRDVMRCRAEQGKWNGGVSPYGYSCQNKTLVINEAEAIVVRHMYNHYLREQSIRFVTHYLNNSGMKTRDHALWAPGSVRRILTNPFYYGMITYSKRSYSYAGELKKSNNAILSVGKHPAIISKDIFDAVRMIIERQSKTAPRSTGKYLLTGAVYCEHCGSRMHGMAYPRLNRIHAYYRCSGHVQKGKTHCKGNSIRVDALEASIIQHLESLAIDPNRLKESLEEQAKESLCSGSVSAESRKRLLADLSRVQDKRSKIFDLYEEGSIAKSDFLGRKALIEAEEVTIKKQLESLEQDSEGACLKSLGVEGVLDYFRNMKDVYDELEAPDRRELIRSLLSEVKVSKHHIDYSVNILPEMVSNRKDCGSLSLSNDTGRGSLRTRA